ncbi:hypothetical protein B0H14DRAFT_3163100 [Mycena olivaceomarginata]|nr:hypothetical protein B0H14DRAFT_3163100 [Mycena olivaceomarginata]
MYAAAMDTGQTAAHLGLAQHSIAPSTLPNSPPVYFSTSARCDQPILQILQDHDTTQCYGTSADSGTSNHGFGFNAHSLQNTRMMTSSSIPAQCVLPYVFSMLLLRFIHIMIFPSTWTDQCQMCGVPRHPSAAWPSSFLTSTRSLFGVFVPLLLDLRVAPFSVCYIQS